MSDADRKRQNPATGVSAIAGSRVLAMRDENMNYERFAFRVVSVVDKIEADGCLWLLPGALLNESVILSALVGQGFLTDAEGFSVVEFDPLTTGYSVLFEGRPAIRIVADFFATVDEAAARHLS
jgi:hypothetical protein